MQQGYIGVLSVGGIISHVSVETDIETLKKSMELLYPREKFDPECDDMRIFDSGGNEVFSFYSE